MLDKSSRIDVQMIFNSPLVGIVVLDLNGLIININDKAFTTLGFSKSLIQEMNIESLLTGETSLDLIKTKYNEGILGMINASGDTCLFNYHYQMCPRSQKGYLSLLLVEKKANSGANKEEVFRQLFHVSKTGLCITDDTHTIIDINDAFADLTLFSQDQLIGHNFLENETILFNSEKERAEIIDSLNKNGNSKKIESRICKQDGKMVFILLTFEEVYLNNTRYWLSSAEDITSLKEQEKKIDNLQTSISEHIKKSSRGRMKFDANLKVTHWDQGCEELFGWSANEILNSKISSPDSLHMDLGDVVSEITEELLSGSVNNNISFHKNHAKCGKIIDCLWFNSVIKNGDGKVLSIVSMVQEISEKTSLKNELQLSNKHLDLFFNNSLSGFFFMMLDEPVEWNDTIDKELTLDYVFAHQRITKANTAILKQYRAKKEEFIGRTPNDFFAHDIKNGKQVWKEFFDNGSLKVHTNERRFDGSHFWVEGDYTLLHNNEGKIIGHFGVQYDVTQEKMALHNVEETSKRLQLAAKSAKLGIFDWNVDNNVIECNGGMHELFEMQDSFIPQTFEDWITFIHPKDLPTFLQKVNLVIHNAQGFDSLFRIITPDDRIKYIELHATVSKDDKDKLKSLVGVCRDITKKITSQHRMDKAILTAQEEERAEIGRELHDHIAQLLATATMYLNYIHKPSESQSTPLDKCLKLINTAIDDVRQLSHRLTPSNIDSNPIERQIHELLESFNFNNKYKIDYRHKVDSGVSLNHELKLNLYRILQEQLNNILKHSKADDIKIYLTIQKDRVRLATIDNGIGFDPKKANRGIGVKNMHRRIEIMHGDIKIISTPNEGCKTIVSIPLN